MVTIPYLQLLSATSFSLFLITGGCTSPHRLVITQPVGPVQGAPELHGGHTGELIVYSSWDRFDPLDAEHRKHTAYKIRPQTGGPVLHVYNRRGSFRSEPELVSLPPGSYVVEARATNVGPVEIPVTIREGETTMVYLDGVTTPFPVSAAETNWVRQPNGSIVGWRDTASAR